MTRISKLSVVSSALALLMMSANNAGAAPLSVRTTMPRFNVQTPKVQVNPQPLPPKAITSAGPQPSSMGGGIQNNGTMNSAAGSAWNGGGGTGGAGLGGGIQNSGATNSVARGIKNNGAMNSVAGGIKNNGATNSAAGSAWNGGGGTGAGLGGGLLNNGAANSVASRTTAATLGGGSKVTRRSHH